MDGNIHIIKLVEMRPVLYKRNANLRDREKCWKELANLLKVKESWVKSRWYLLRERFTMEYRNEATGTFKSDYKYLKDMAFLVDHTSIDKYCDDVVFEDLSTTDVQMKPEFLVTLKDIDVEIESGNESDHSLFAELVVGEEDDKAENQVKEFDISESVTKIDKEINNKVLEYDFTCDQSAKEKIRSNTLQANLKNILLDNNETESEKDYQFKKKYKLSCGQIENHQQAPFGISNQASKYVLSSKVNEKSRNEDVIFGELVAAMLQQMDENKNKSIKKQIMNLLLD